MVCKVHLEGWGNTDWRKVQDLGPSFRADSKHLFFKAPPHALWLMPTVRNKCFQKFWSLYIQGRWKRPYQTITVQMTNLLHILRHVLLPMFAKCTLYGLNSVTQFIFPWCQFCYSVQSLAILLENAVLYALGKNSEGSWLRVLRWKHFHLHSQGETSCLFLKKWRFLLVITGKGIQLKVRKCLTGLE